MSNFVFLDHHIDTYAIKNHLLAHPEYWHIVDGMTSIGGEVRPRGFLPLVMGIQEEGKTIKNSDLLKPTPVFEDKVLREMLFTDILNKYEIQSVARAAFFKLEPGGIVHTHIDDGTYYQTKDRYHLSISGEYEYTVDGEMHHIYPGTLFWFDNKKLHGAKNYSNEDRITFVFDVPHKVSPINQRKKQ